MLSATFGVSLLTERMSLILSMLDTVPDVFVDGVLGEVEPRDVLNVEGVSHRLRDVVLSNLNRLKK